MKLCLRCYKEKDTVEFGQNRRKEDGLCIYCKKCRSAIDKAKREQLTKYQKNWRKKHPNYHKNYISIWNQDNKSKKQEWYNKNKEKINEKQKFRRINDINYKLSSCLRRRLYKALKNNQKHGSAIYDLGCSVEDLKMWLEDQFQDGMTWDNHGKWHIDHIKPLAFFDLTDRKQLLEACHYTNLQPLWAKENCKKSDKW